MYKLTVRVPTPEASIILQSIEADAEIGRVKRILEVDGEFLVVKFEGEKAKDVRVAARATLD
eukprot:CAMPEP_0118659098 /NCGR_PEP_ID=MMETSP0785-20121206/14923_1 /TAXON_ID=91992 /ORGANISM="Bolidomonas pacifica, Strain CCMP 1866" /LENGTH=61 /DNA_ID=CAMNT_0006552165 /DNA_START=147 /DNA_END=329 /DNA_ORIENTATION=+